MEKGGDGRKKMAVLVGCNYEGTQYKLHGCQNDVLSMRDVLIKRFGFDCSNIQLMMDKPGSPVMPTASNIKSALGRMVDQSQPGDVLFFHFSGHGTLIAKHHHREEAIVALDFNLITSTDFREIVNRVAEGAIFTILSDSCHSGGLIDKEKEQIGPAHIPAPINVSPSTKTHSKFIPFHSLLLHHLSSLTNININNTTTADDNDITSSLSFGEALKADEGILLSGCQADEVSQDIVEDSPEGRAYGAFSNAVQSVLREHSEPLSNKELVLMARRVLEMKHLGKQHPCCLYCSDQNAVAPFLAQSETKLPIQFT
nr:metacaspase-9-like [Ipomoea trifida]